MDESTFSILMDLLTLFWLVVAYIFGFVLGYYAAIRKKGEE